MIQLGYGVWLVTRAEWGARRPRSVTALWVDLATSHWEGPHMGVFGHESCAAKVRGIQAFHMDSRGWSDIAYNAVACPHGYVFEGRGDGVRSAANGTTAGNSGAYAVCYLGGEGDGFTDAGERAMKAAGDWLTRAGSPRNGHRDWKSTACPGDEIYNWTHAGQPVDTAPAPAPDPPEEEDDMPVSPWPVVRPLIVATGADGVPAGTVFMTDGKMLALRWVPPEQIAAVSWRLRNARSEAFPDGFPDGQEPIDDVRACGHLVGPEPPGWPWPG